MNTEYQTGFNIQQIANYRSFEIVRSSGAYNMYDPRARELSGLSRDEYRFVMDNFAALRKQANEEDGE